jgi:hypothetical protein
VNRKGPRITNTLTFTTRFTGPPHDAVLESELWLTTLATHTNSFFLAMNEIYHALPDEGSEAFWEDFEESFAVTMCCIDEWFPGYMLRASELLGR